MYQIIAQALGIVAMVFSVTSFQLKTKKQIIIMQILTSVVFATHYFMINAITAAVVNLVAIVRNIVFYNKNKPFFKSRMWVWGFATVMALCGAASWQGPISLLMCVGMVFNTLAVGADKPINTRKLILISSPFVLMYNIWAMSVGGIINESLVIIITLITLLAEVRNTSKSN